MALVFTTADSGITWQAESGETPVLSGGVAGLPQQSRIEVWSAPGGVETIFRRSSAHCPKVFGSAPAKCHS